MTKTPNFTPWVSESGKGWSGRWKRTVASLLLALQLLWPASGVAEARARRAPTAARPVVEQVIDLQSNNDYYTIQRWNVVFNVDAVSDLDMSGMTVNGNFNAWDVKRASNFVMPDVVSWTAFFNNLESLDGVVFSRKLWWSLHLEKITKDQFIDHIREGRMRQLLYNRNSAAQVFFKDWIFTFSQLLHEVSPFPVYLEDVFDTADPDVNASLSEIDWDKVLNLMTDVLDGKYKESLAEVNWEHNIPSEINTWVNSVLDTERKSAFIASMQARLGDLIESYFLNNVDDEARAWVKVFFDKYFVDKDSVSELLWDLDYNQTKEFYAKLMDYMKRNTNRIPSNITINTDGGILSISVDEFDTIKFVNRGDYRSAIDLFSDHVLKYLVNESDGDISWFHLDRPDMDRVWINMSTFSSDGDIYQQLARYYDEEKLSTPADHVIAVWRILNNIGHMRKEYDASSNVLERYQSDYDDIFKVLSEILNAKEALLDSWTAWEQVQNRIKAAHLEYSSHQEKLKLLWIYAIIWMIRWDGNTEQILSDIKSLKVEIEANRDWFSEFYKEKKDEIVRLNPELRSEVDTIKGLLSSEKLNPILQRVDDLHDVVQGFSDLLWKVSEKYINLDVEIQAQRSMLSYREKRQRGLDKTKPGYVSEKERCDEEIKKLKSNISILSKELEILVKQVQDQIDAVKSEEQRKLLSWLVVDGRLVAPLSLIVDNMSAERVGTSVSGYVFDRTQVLPDFLQGQIWDNDEFLWNRQEQLSNRINRLTETISWKQNEIKETEDAIERYRKEKNTNSAFAESVKLPALFMELTKLMSEYNQTWYRQQLNYTWTISNRLITIDANISNHTQNIYDIDSTVNSLREDIDSYSRRLVDLNEMLKKHMEATMPSWSEEYKKFDETYDGELRSEIAELKEQIKSAEWEIKKLEEKRTQESTMLIKRRKVKEYELSVRDKILANAPHEIMKVLINHYNKFLSSFISEMNGYRSEIVEIDDRIEKLEERKKSLSPTDREVSHINTELRTLQNTRRNMQERIDLYNGYVGQLVYLIVDATIVNNGYELKYENALKEYQRAKGENKADKTVISRTDLNPWDFDLNYDFK